MEAVYPWSPIPVFPSLCFQAVASAPVLLSAQAEFAVVPVPVAATMGFQYPEPARFLGPAPARRFA